MTDQRPIRILHIVGGMNRGGVETWLMHVLRHIDRERYQMDFLVQKTAPGAYDDEIRALGSRIIACPHPHRPWVPENGRDDQSRWLIGVQHSDVVLRFSRDDLSGSPAAIGKLHFDLSCVDHDVEGRQNVAALIDDHAAAHTYPLIFGIPSPSLNEDKGREDGLVDLGRVRRRGCRRSHGLRDACVDFAVRGDDRGREEQVVEQHTDLAARRRTHKGIALPHSHYAVKKTGIGRCPGISIVFRD